MIEELFKQAVQKTKEAEAKFCLSLGKVTAVNDDTIDVGLYKSVRLTAVLGASDSHYIIKPKLGSNVIIGRLENEDVAFLVSTSEIESFEVKIGSQLLSMQSGKYVLKNGTENLKEILTDLMTNLQTAVIITPAGPGSFSPNDITGFSLMINRINQLLG
ncbi:MAG: hypothetical protein RQ756_02535 [Flavobacteriaceae bacterium]|nr:hypothetical protein [Flavobacteriaceae bacterium]